MKPIADAPVPMLDRVDGRKVSMGSSAVCLAPGLHELAVTCRWPSWAGTLSADTLTVEVVAGAQRELRAGTVPEGQSCPVEARALAYRAVMARIETRFITAADLMVQLAAARRKDQLKE